MLDDPCVKCIPGQTHAGITQEIGGLSSATANPWPNPDYGEVTCATSEVTDHNQLVVVERGFVVVRRRHGLIDTAT